MTVTPRWLHRIAPAAARQLDWERIYAEELPRVYNFFRFRVGDNMLAEDLTAVTFEKAWRARERYRHDRAKFSTWLFTIARNVAADFFRREKAELSWDSLRAQPGAASPEELASRRDEFARLSTLLAQLPARERELVALKYGSGLTNREIARLTNMSESNVGTILHRVTAQLRAEFEKQEA